MFELSDLFINPFAIVLEFMQLYGWYVLGACLFLTYVFLKTHPDWDQWLQMVLLEGSRCHKGASRSVAVRMHAVENVRRQQQQALTEASQRALEIEKERQRRKKEENARRLKKYSNASGSRLGTDYSDDYFPLSGDGGSQTFKAAKRSACSGGGCGR